MGLLWYAVLSVGVCAPISAWLAARRDRRRGLWALYGVILGPIALAILAVAPPGVCPVCGSQWPGWEPRCPTCAAGRGAPPAVRQPEAADDAQAKSTASVAVNPQPAASKEAVASSAPEVRRPVPGTVSGSTEAPTAHETFVAATGIFLDGYPALTIGLPYGIGIKGQSVVVTGPLTTAPGEIVVERPLDTADISIAPERTLLTAGQLRRGRPEVGLIFGSLAVARGIDLEEVIRASAAEGRPGVQSRGEDA